MAIELSYELIGGLLTLGVGWAAHVTKQVYDRPTREEIKDDMLIQEKLSAAQYAELKEHLKLLENMLVNNMESLKEDIKEDIKDLKQDIRDAKA